MSVPIQVQTSIDPQYVKFATDIPSEVYVKDIEQVDYDLVIFIEVLNRDEIPIEGKYPEKIYIESNETSGKESIEIEIQHYSNAFSASKEDGIMAIPVKITKMEKSSLFAYVTLEIDSINATTPLIEFIPFLSINDEVLSAIKFTSVPETLFKNGLEFNETFQIKAKAFNIFGDELDFDYENTVLIIYFSPQNPKTPKPLLYFHN